MEQFDFFYGTQMAEFELDVPDINGIKLDIDESKNSIIIKPSNTKVVILNVHN